MAKEQIYLAKHTLHITETPGKSGDKAKGVSPTPPKVKVVPAGAKVKLDPDSQDAKDFLKAKAIVPSKEEPETVETVGKKTTTRKAPAKKPAPAKKAAPAKKTEEPSGDGGEGGDGEDGDDGSDLV